jgi:hypothetical protein
LRLIIEREVENMGDRVNQILKDAGFTLVIWEDTKQAIDQHELQIINAIKCAYCGKEIELGQRWVREKVYQRTSGCTASYRCYHADPFPGHALSCWERHELEAEIERVKACAA